MKFTFLIMAAGGIFLLNYFYQDLRGWVHFRFAPDQKNPETVNFPTADKVKIYGWYSPVEDPRAAIILVHGLNSSRGKMEWAKTVNFLNKNNFSVLSLDLRATGQSEGDRSYLGTKEWQDLEAGYNYLKNLPENKDLKIGFLGKSIGGAAAIITAGKTGKGDFVVAVAPYLNHQELWAQRLQKKNLPEILSPVYGLAANWELGWDYWHYRPDFFIKNIQVPIFIIWAENDNVAGKGSEKLLQMANEPKVGWQAPTSHDIIGEAEGEFNKKLLEFFDKMGL